MPVQPHFHYFFLLPTSPPRRVASQGFVEHAEAGCQAPCPHRHYPDPRGNTDTPHPTGLQWCLFLPCRFACQGFATGFPALAVCAVAVEPASWLRRIGPTSGPQLRLGQTLC